MRELRTGMEICGEYGSECIRDGCGRVGGGEMGIDRSKNARGKILVSRKGEESIYNE